ncbi:MAG: aquaporin [Capsulimonadaceae bacterium]|nr:aquaporin [Capsulimonadaceae bacterium]
MRQRYAAEAIGTFGIVFAPVALSGAHSLTGADGSLMAAAWVSGLAVLAMIYALGHISAAHFNPAVSIGFAVARRFPWRYVGPYILSQLAGAIVAAALAACLFGPGHGVHIPRVSALHAVLMEATLTFLLMLVIIAVATDRRANGAIPGLAIGLTVVFDVMIGGPATGGSMNPARTLGPALFGGATALSHVWIYIAAPIAGAVIAATLYESIRGGEEHAKGAPNDLYEALMEIQESALKEQNALAGRDIR